MAVHLYVTSPDLVFPPSVNLSVSVFAVFGRPRLCWPKHKAGQTRCAGKFKQLINTLRHHSSPELDVSSVDNVDAKFHNINTICMRTEHQHYPTTLNYILMRRTQLSRHIMSHQPPIGYVRARTRMGCSHDSSGQSASSTRYRFPPCLVFFILARNAA